MAYLAWWLENEVNPNRVTRTYEEYELAIRLCVVPFIGPKKLDRLNAIDITTWMSAVVRHKFTNNMRKRALRILRIALNRNKTTDHRQEPRGCCRNAEAQKAGNQATGSGQM